jgi:calmodulin-lysine N-methyltransferase
VGELTVRRGVCSGKRVLELGAGAGLAGMVLAATGLAKEVVLTDGNPTVVQTLQLNVQRNQPAFAHTKVSAHMLHWAKYDGHLGYFDVVIAADWCVAAAVLVRTSAASLLRAR